MPYPATIVPIKASQICRGPYQNETRKDCGCLLFHRDRIFGDIHSHNPEAVKMRKALNETTKLESRDRNESVVIEYNERAPKEEQARAFNRALLRIGYVRKGRVLVWKGKRKSTSPASESK